MSGRKKGIPRYRDFDGPVLFRHGFRPFFLGAGIWSLAALALWLAAFQGTITLPSAFAPALWHAHEMLFGFAVATICGFLLTAIPNWTGRMPLQGVPLMVLFAVWLAGRLAGATSALIGAGAGAAIDLAFLGLLFAVVLREILAGRNWRNLPMPVAIAALFAANLLMHLGAMGRADTAALGERLAAAIIIMLIALVGGRIIPSFTRNWLVKRGEAKLPADFGAFDTFCLAFTLYALLAWVGAPDAANTGWALIAAGLAHFVRLARWRGHRAISESLVWSLHLGFFWLPLGLVLLGLGLLLPTSVPATAGLHALTAGAIGSMTLAVMTRASLGHTGRGLAADGPTTAIYVLIFLAAATRVAAPLAVGSYMELLWASGLLWAGAFGLFSLHYGRILISERAPRSGGGADS